MNTFALSAAGILVALSVAGCGGADETAAAGGQALAAGPSKDEASDRDPALTAPTPRGLMSCSDRSDHSTPARLRLKADLGLEWEIGSEQQSSTVLAVSKKTKNDESEYSILTARGDVITLLAKPLVIQIGPALVVECYGDATADTKALDALVELTQASTARRQAFATCTETPNGEPTSYTVRPPLAGGRGAIIESKAQKDLDGAFSLLATEVDERAGAAVYTGAGGLTGQHATGDPFSQLTLQSSGATTSFVLDPTASVPFQPGGCTVTGGAFAKSLLQPSGS